MLIYITDYTNIRKFSWIVELSYHASIESGCSTVFVVMVVYINKSLQKRFYLNTVSQRIEYL